MNGMDAVANLDVSIMGVGKRVVGLYKTDGLRARLQQS